MAGKLGVANKQLRYEKDYCQYYSGSYDGM